jgi:hypothetical protein
MTAAFSTPPPAARPEPSPKGSLKETAGLLVVLAADLISVPFHFLAFLMTRESHCRHFQKALQQGAASTPERGGGSTHS